MSPPLSPESVQALLLSTKNLLPAQEKEILALGSAIDDTLLSLLVDEALLNEDGPGNGWAPIHAASLAGKLRLEAAIPRLIELTGQGYLTIIASSALRALEAIGDAAVGPAIDAAERTKDLDHRGMLLEVLVHSDQKDERIYQLLLQAFQDKPSFTISKLGQYGDARATPVLLEYLEAYVPDADDKFMADQDIIELRAAFENLDAELTAPQQALLDRRRAELDRKREAYFHGPLAKALSGSLPSTSATPAKKKVGRNDPCPCGSGKKYKKCHGA